MNSLLPLGADWRHQPGLNERVAELLTRMSLHDKIELVSGDLNYNFGFYSAAVTGPGLPELTMADGPCGVRINNGAVHGGRATALPAPIALAATWNTELARAYGDVLGHEARASGHNVILAPAVDIARVPVGGRTFESFGEDPLLNARMALAEVPAIQAHAVAACLKHYAVNNQEHERASVNAAVDEATLREIYLRPFEAVVRHSAVASLMGAFNRVNGVFACENPWLLDQVLRREWGFAGWVMSDYAATHSTVPSAQAGLDQEQPSAQHYGDRLQQAVEQGQLPLATLDEMCRRILRTVIGLQLMERPPAIAPMNDQAHRSVAQTVAEQAVVLLKNDGDLLPVRPEDLRRVVVIGPDIDNANVAGGGSSRVQPAHAVSLLEGLRLRLGPDVLVQHAVGNDPISAADLLPGPDSLPSDCLRSGPMTDAGPGLYTRFWSNPHLGGEACFECVMPQVALNGGFFNFPGFDANSSGYPKLPNELSGAISARFTGRLVVPESGRYELSATLLGTVRIWLDGELVLDAYRAGGGSASGAGASAAAWGAHADVKRAADGSDSPVAPDWPVAQAQMDLRAHTLPEASERPPQPLGSGGGDAGPPPQAAGVALQLQAGPQGHELCIEYLANAPSQGWLTGAQLRLGWRPPSERPTAAMREACTLAEGADLVVLAVRSYETEQMDRPDLHLPNNQAALVRAVAAANPRTVVINMSGGPVETESWESGVPAILQAWYLGQEQGSALARILVGDVNPSGKLPLSFPLSAHGLLRSRAQYPGEDGTVHYSEGLQVGYRGFDARGLPVRFAFGHGLSYTRFEYGDLEVHADTDGLALSFTVRNSGDHAGREVAQVYLGLPLPDQPPHRLVDFVSLPLAAGESRRVRRRISRHDPGHPLSVWTDDAWQCARGLLRVAVGSSSRDLRLKAQVRF